MTFDLPGVPARPTRRTVLRIGAVSAWTVPVVGVISAAPAFAAVSGVSPSVNPAFIDIAASGAPVTFNNIGNNATDDATGTCTSGFAITFYGGTTATVRVSINGVVFFTDTPSAPNTDYDNKPLPTSSFGRAALPYWDDLLLLATGDAVRYETRGTAGDRVFVVQWNVHCYNQSGTQFVFQLQFFEKVAGRVAFCYKNVTGATRPASDNGGSATVGVQQSSTGPFQQTSFGNDTTPAGNVIPNGAVLVYNKP